MSDRAKGLLTFYLLKLKDEQLSDATKKSYASIARQFAYFLEDNQLSQKLTATTCSSIAQEFLSCSIDNNGSSVNTRASAIKHFLKMLGVPCGTLERPTVRLTTREVLTEQELQSFLFSARKFCSRDKAIGLLLASTGIKLKECAALNLHNIDFNGDVLMLEIERTTGRQQIPLTADVQSAIEEYLDEREDLGNSDQCGFALFIDKNGERLSMRAITSAVRKIGWAAKLAVTPALLRVTRLTGAARKNDDAVSLAYLAGFDSLEAARRIIRASKKDVSRASVQANLNDLCFRVADNKMNIVAESVVVTNQASSAGIAII